MNKSLRILLLLGALTSLVLSTARASDIIGSTAPQVAQIDSSAAVSPGITPPNPDQVPGDPPPPPPPPEVYTDIAVGYAWIYGSFVLL